MYCLNCGKEIPEGNAFCEYCGKPVISSEEMKEKKLQETEVLTELPYREAFDEPAGAADIYEEEYETTPKQKREKPKWFIPVLFLGLAVISVAAGIFVASLTNGGDPEDGTVSDPPEASEPSDPGDIEDSDEPEDMVEDNDALMRVYAGCGTGGSEHTYDSYDDAMDQGAACIEQDVWMSSDGTLFVKHKKWINEEAGLSIENCTSSQVRNEAPGILKLSEVFDEYGTDITYVVEIKTNSRQAADEFIDLVEDYGYEDNVIAQSFYPEVLRRVDDELPGVPIMCLCDQFHTDFCTFDEAIRTGFIDIVAVSYDEGMMTEENCDRAHDEGKDFAAWGLDSRSKIKKAIRMGVDSYFTTDPEEALSLEEEFRD